MTTGREQLLVEHLGRPCLAYLLNTSEADIKAHFNQAKRNPLSTDQSDVLSQLIDTDQRLAQNVNSRFVYHSWQEFLLSLDTDSEKAWGSSFRSLAGGEVSTLSGSDNVYKDTLVQLASDAYPAFLIRTAQADDFPAAIFIHQHPLAQRFEDEIVYDKKFDAFFSHYDESSGRRSANLLRSTGFGSAVQLWGLAATFLDSGWRLASLRSSMPTPTDFMESVLDSLSLAKDAIGGMHAEVPGRIGITGALLPGNIADTSVGSLRLRLPDARDSDFIRTSGIEGELATTTDDDGYLEISYAGDITVETTVPYRIEARTDAMVFDTWPKDLMQGINELHENIENLRLGLLLAIPGERASILRTWQFTFDPFAQGLNLGWNDPRENNHLHPLQLDETQLNEWLAWTDSINRLRTPTIGVAIRRMLASAAERDSPEDVLVDAVIVWENLFGARSETTLRVTSSLAWLLGSDEEDRIARQKHYKEIYTYRSQIVHGAPKIDPEKVRRYSEESIDISIAALRALFAKRPELLKEKSAEWRSVRIMHAGDMNKIDS
jgi:hypothetical protein